MNILLDTHILLWHLTDNPKLSKEKSAIIENPENGKFFSIASLWEIGIKKSIGKLDINRQITELIPIEVNIIAIKPTHIEKIMELPFHHRDPFNRMIIAQSMLDDLVVMTDDQNFKYYSVKLLT